MGNSLASGRGSLRLALVGCALICTWVLASPTDADAAGTFTCRAMGTTKAATTVANPANDPCANDSASPLSFGESPGVYIPPGSPSCVPICRGEPYGYHLHVGYSDASTHSATNRGLAVVRVGDILIHGMDQSPIPNPVYMEIDVANAVANSNCVASAPVLSASSSVAYVSQDGVLTETSDPIDIDLTSAFLGTIHLNSIQSSSNEIVARALWWDIPGQGEQNDFIAGEARAGFTGNPCT